MYIHCAHHGPQVDGLRIRLIDTCGLEDPEAGDTVNYGVSGVGGDGVQNPVARYVVLSTQGFALTGAYPHRTWTVSVAQAGTGTGTGTETGQAHGWGPLQGRARAVLCDSLSAHRAIPSSACAQYTLRLSPTRAAAAEARHWPAALHMHNTRLLARYELLPPRARCSLPLSAPPRPCCTCTFLRLPSKQNPSSVPCANFRHLPSQALAKIAEDVRGQAIDVVLYVDRLDLYRVDPLDKAVRAVQRVRCRTGMWMCTCPNPTAVWLSWSADVGRQ